MAIILAHESLGGGKCCGCITALERGDGRSDLICNECGERIRTVASAQLEWELASLAEKVGYSVFPCAHCGALNVCTEIALADVLVCPRCGTDIVKSISAMQQDGELG
jgi:predicted RNA-binding Zn-ribbon protein involved in translation (DUF1610 family)